MIFVAQDCSPLNPQPTAKQANWLHRLSANMRAAELVVSISGERDEDEPIVYCDRDGIWKAGRYVGSIAFEGCILKIEPRFGLPALKGWISEVASVKLVDTLGKLREDESFIANLLASVWARNLAEAARHGLPALRREVTTRGLILRGRLDVSASIRSIAEGCGQVVSIRSERSLDHAASDAIIAAYTVLRRWLEGQEEKWLPARTKELLSSLMAVTGTRPHVPTKAELKRVRYTPITAGFAPVAELSRQIANRKGLATSLDSNEETKGVLLDVAELWEMYVLSVLRKAAAPLTIIHGTRDKFSNKKLLRSNDLEQSIGTLIPDGIIQWGSDVRGIVDAKYKSLHPSASSQSGPQRNDLYQMVTYLASFQPHSDRAAWGLLVYPFDPKKPDMPNAEQKSPWSLGENTKISFCTLPHNSAEAVEKLCSLIFQIQPAGNLAN
ncbi:McrC family protein [Comamonas sp. NLF-1-9]|uniref:McrC family protein n=1 Tax=Comamonas sp. NLF-1-9 TaxID=2853163 RepID=UPI001C48AB64|nr:McrC family protein [Comamonas sp. NLF-1-9]QXL85241.1 McrC family protein [Comamonas sp. NLF-1-9]